ncbi:hypothetical protein EV363DRAFT_1182992 [Boletus edulis]|nr:hypothetical protein EV363DRAFT_1182992 [Boletus edulis]
MVHWWDDPEVEAHLGVIYVDLAFFLLGIHGWEYFRSFGIEYAIIRGRLPWRWPLVPYLLGRLFLLTLLLLLAVETSPFSGPFTCQYTPLCLHISGAIAIGASSANLMIRTWVIWQNSRPVHLLLLLLSLGHWTVLALDTVNIKSFRSNGACTIYLMHPAVSAGVFVYTMCYDFLVFVLSIIKLSKEPCRSPLSECLRSQGLLYFAVAVVANILPTVCPSLAPFPIVYSSSSTGFCFHWSSRYDHFLFVLPISNSIHTSYGGYHWQFW